MNEYPERTVTVTVRSVFSALGFALMLWFTYQQFVGYIMPLLQTTEFTFENGLGPNGSQARWACIALYILACITLGLGLGIFIRYTRVHSILTSMVRGGIGLVLVHALGTWLYQMYEKYVLPFM